MPNLSSRVIKRTLYVSIVAALISISISTSIRVIGGYQSDMITIIVRLVLPFLIAVPIGLFWFLKLEKLEIAYGNAIKRANEMAQLASVDPLTGLLNRRSFIKYFDAAKALLIRRWFLIADIDYLKSINDMYGHAVGDDAVIAVAQALVAELPTDSLIARIGGDEFCASIPKEDCPDIELLIKQVNIKAQQLFEKKQPAINHVLSISAGAIPYKQKAKFEDVMSVADIGLYRKKRARTA